MAISVRSWSPKGHFACKLGGSQQLCCLFSNTFLTSSISNLHDTRGWWWHSGLNKYAPLDILDPMPLLWITQASQRMLSQVTSWLPRRFQCGRGVCGLQEMPVLKYPGGWYLLGLHTQWARALLQQLVIFRGHSCFSPFFGRHVPCFADSAGKMVSSPPSKCADSWQDWSPMLS